jgi:hypothetical protein
MELYRLLQFLTVDGLSSLVATNILPFFFS